ncbi:MAG: hypothetical protein JAY74_03905 [Candidatus Thiodiazotropha taylori]|nr:hypothetical protein [Candidatus Thiodiazotropha taylori]
MNIEIEEDIFESDDEIEPGGETTEEATDLVILDFRRRIERLFELKQLREMLDEPDLEDIL